MLPDEADARLDELIEVLGSLGVSPVDFLLLVSRNVRYVDLPHTQERFGRRRVEAAGGDARDAAAGHLAQGGGGVRYASVVEHLEASDEFEDSVFEGECFGAPFFFA